MPTRDKRDSKDDSTTLPLGSESTNQLLQFAIRTRIIYSIPPISTGSLLCTMIMGWYNQVLRIVDIDDESNIEEYMQVTMIFMWAFDLGFKNLLTCLTRISSDCCTKYCGVLYIVRIRPKVGANIIFNPTVVEKTKRPDKPWVKRETKPMRPLT